MERTERFYKIDRLLRDNRSVSLERFLEVLSVSKATFKRDIEYMRDRLSAPIIWDRELRGYVFEKHVEHHVGHKSGTLVDRQKIDPPVWKKTHLRQLTNPTASLRGDAHPAQPELFTKGVHSLLKTRARLGRTDHADIHRFSPCSIDRGDGLAVKPNQPPESVAIGQAQGALADAQSRIFSGVDVPHAIGVSPVIPHRAVNLRR